jgi:peptide/nickel transport system substrate-binding protein
MAEVMMPRAGIGWVADPSGFAPGPFGFMFFDTLLWADNKGAIKPNLVTKWEVAPDLKSITLTLGQGIKFHDGSELNATVLKWNLDQLINNKIADYIFATSVDMVDNYTVRVNLKSYSNAILTTMGSTPIMSKAAYDAKGGGKAAEDWLRDNPVGTGPFKFVSYKPNVLIQGAKFNDYWQKGKPYLDGIDYYYIPDVMTKSATLQSGEMDVIAGDLTKAEYDLLQKGFQVTKDYISIACFVPDSKNPNSPFANVKVRQAIEYAINRPELAALIGYGKYVPLTYLAAPGSLADPGGDPHAFNVQKAKDLLKEAGYPSGFKTQLLTIQRDAVTAAAIQGYLKAVGIDCTLDMADTSRYYNQIWTTTGWSDITLVMMPLATNSNEIIFPYHNHIFHFFSTGNIKTFQFCPVGGWP